MIRARWLAAAVAVTALVAGCAPLPPAAGPVEQRLEFVVDRWRRRAGVPAVSIAIRGATDWTAATGTADVAGNGARVRDSTQFRVASITKMFVATVVMQLVEDGALGLDDRAAEVAEHLPIPAEVTVRQLLNHTSGLPDYGTEPFVDGLQRERTRRWTAPEILADVADLRVEFAPGTDWQYSNTNYLVLGELITAATGRPWVHELRRRVLEPLGLDSTYVAGLERPRGAGLVDAAYFDLDNDGDQEDVEEGSWPALETSEGAAGAVISTASDVATFTQALFTGRLLTRETGARMVQGTAFGRRYDDYGFGVELSRPDLQTQVWGHGGFLPGYRSTTWFEPESGTTITVLLNDSRAAPADLAELLALVIS